MTSRNSKSFVVDFLEAQTLVEFDGLIQIGGKLLLRDIEHSDLNLRRSLVEIRVFQPPSCLLAESDVPKPAPGRFELLESRIVQNRIDLARQDLIQLRDILRESPNDRFSLRLLARQEPAAHPHLQSAARRRGGQQILEQSRGGRFSRPTWPRAPRPSKFDVARGPGCLSAGLRCSAGAFGGGGTARL